MGAHAESPIFVAFIIVRTRPAGMTPKGKPDHRKGSPANERTVRAIQECGNRVRRFRDRLQVEHLSRSEVHASEEHKGKFVTDFGDLLLDVGGAKGLLALSWRAENEMFVRIDAACAHVRLAFLYGVDACAYRRKHACMRGRRRVSACVRDCMCACM